MADTRTQETMQEWSRRMKWRMLGYRIEPAVNTGKRRARARFVDVLAPLLDDAQVGAGGAPDEVIHKSVPTLFGRLFGTSKTGREELIDFIEAMGSAIDSGASEADALALSASTCQTPRMRGVISAMFTMVNNGVELATAMALFPDTFNPMIVALARAAESGKDKGKVFARLAEKMRNDSKLMRRFLGAIAYPVTLLCGAIVVAIVLQIKALPPMVETFIEMGAKLPAVTQGFYDVSTFMRNYWYILFPSVIVAFVLAVKNAGRFWRLSQVQRLSLKIPFIGVIMRGMCMSRALNAFCMLKTNGASDSELYKLTGDAASQLVFKEFFDAVYLHVSSGVPVEDAYMRERDRIGPEGLWIASKLRVGAFSGDTVPLLQKAADELQDRTEARLALLPQAIELPLLGVCAAIVGSIVLAIFLPYPSLIIDVLQKQNH